MSSPDYRLRRATVDDLDQLRSLWQEMKLPADELEKRVTEFQVAESPEGRVAGALGLQIAQRHGRIHGEVFADFSLADQLRQLLWERLQKVAANHGLVRLWTQEAAPFWHQNGFLPAGSEALARLPAAWQNSASQWLTLQLKEETESENLPIGEKELERFMAAEREQTEKMFRQAKMLKAIATTIAVGLVLMIIMAIVYIFRKNPNLLQPRRFAPTSAQGAIPDSIAHPVRAEMRSFAGGTSHFDQGLV